MLIRAEKFGVGFWGLGFSNSQPLIPNPQPLTSQSLCRFRRRQAGDASGFGAEAALAQAYGVKAFLPGKIDFSSCEKSPSGPISTQ